MQFWDQEQSWYTWEDHEEKFDGILYSGTSLTFALRRYLIHTATFAYLSIFTHVYIYFGVQFLSYKRNCSYAITAHLTSGLVANLLLHIIMLSQIICFCVQMWSYERAAYLLPYVIHCVN